MGIYINLGMPKCCHDCWALDDRHDYPLCLITDEQKGYLFDDRKRRMDKCPLIEVPPHGRLVDADKMIKRYMPDMNRQIYGGNFIFDLEQNAMTIIPAEKGEEE